MTIYIGENIKRLRHEKGITQETLADFLTVSFQSVSRWERGESYPDITLLPVIAGFFGVSIDELMGMNEAEDEKEIQKLLEEYDNLTDEELIRESISILKERYPNDFRVQLRWMGYLMFYDGWDNLEQNTPKIISVYRNIQDNCTNDSVRICAKRYYIYFMSNLACKKDAKVTFEDYEPVISEMPFMRDGRENYCYLYRLHNHPDADKKIMEAIEEQIFLAYDTVYDYCLTNKFSRDYQIEIHEKTKDFFNYIYNDGNYSRFWRTVMSRCYGMLGWLYSEEGDEEKALYNLRRAGELAVEFDNLDRITILQSTILKGKAFDKQVLGSNFIAKSWMKENILNYPLSDEFKNTKEFREIVTMLEG